jgi:hypothetical protein
MHTVVELPEYLRQVERLLSERERQALVDYLAEHPKAGVIMRGTGGIRKLRWARPGWESGAVCGSSTTTITSRYRSTS